MSQTAHTNKDLEIINEIFNVSQRYFANFLRKNIALKFYIDLKIVIIEDLQMEAELRSLIFWYIKQRRNLACYQISNKLIT
jgi:hypothetical protein